MNSLLSDLQVLDLSRILAGPWATQTLADLGAKVIKVERPEVGDDTRSWGPPFASQNSYRESTYFLCANRGKRSVTIDFTTKEGAELIRKMAARSDVFVENFKVGGLAKYGLDYESLRKLNPRLIYCSITGFGQTGPYAKRPGYDALIQAMGGLMSITGEPDDRPGGGPQKVGVAIVDILAGMYATTAILAALHERERSGEGQRIDVALFDVQIAALANQASAYLMTGQVPGRLGSAHPSIVPYQPFVTSDGHVMLAIANDNQFRSFCTAIGREDLSARFPTNESRVSRREELIPILTEIFRTKPMQAWVELGEANGFPCGPINRIDQVFDDPHVRENQTVIEIPHERLGKVRSVRNPIRLSRTPVSMSMAPPILGAHTEEVLKEFGITEEEIERLREKHVI